MCMQAFSAGETILHQGALVGEDDFMYLLDSGEVDVVISGGQSSEEHKACSCPCVCTCCACTHAAGHCPVCVSMCTVFYVDSAHVAQMHADLRTPPSVSSTGSTNACYSC